MAIETLKKYRELNKSLNATMAFYISTDIKMAREALWERFVLFKKTLDDPNIEPVRLFDPIGQKEMEELILIRDVSRYLQKKKDDELTNTEQVEVTETEVEREENTETQKEEPAE